MRGTGSGEVGAIRRAHEQRGSRKRACRAVCSAAGPPGAYTDQVPTLLRHYLRLKGQIVCFNVEPEFGSCLDGLMVVDLLQSDPKLLAAYMGKQEVEEFMRWHEAHGTQPTRAPEPADAEII